MTQIDWHGGCQLQVQIDKSMPTTLVGMNEHSVLVFLPLKRHFVLVSLADRSSSRPRSADKSSNILKFYC